MLQIHLDDSQLINALLGNINKLQWELSNQQQVTGHWKAAAQRAEAQLQEAVQQQSVDQQGAAGHPQVVVEHQGEAQCKYGPLGHNKTGTCQFEHPQCCPSFELYGWNTRMGCKKSKKCRYLHRDICKKVARFKKCNEEGCQGLHPRGILQLWNGGKSRMASSRTSQWIVSRATWILVNWSTS